MRRFVFGIIASAFVAAGNPALAEPAGDQGHGGAALYEQYCRPCHGADLKGYGADNAPSLSSPTFRATADDAFLRAAIERGRAGTAMGGYGREFGGPLGPSDVDALIAFVRGGTKPAPLEERRTMGRAARGSDVFRTHCESCHGTPNQRRDSVHLANAMFLETASDAYLRVAIEEGRPGTRMEAWRGKLSSQQIEDVVAYLRSLARPVSPPPPDAEEGRVAREGPVVINPGGEQASLTLKDDLYVSVAEVAEAYKHKRRLVIVDARSPADFLRLHITGAISVPYFDMRDLDRVPNDGTWVIAYCACPHHVSGIVVAELRKRGYAHSAVLDEGVFAWQQGGNPVDAAPGQLPIPAPPGNPASKSPD